MVELLDGFFHINPVFYSMVRATALELGIEPATLLNRLKVSSQLKILLAEHHFFTTASGTWLYHHDEDVRDYVNGKLRNTAQAIAEMFDTIELVEKPEAYNDLIIKSTGNELTFRDSPVYSSPDGTLEPAEGPLGTRENSEEKNTHTEKT